MTLVRAHRCGRYPPCKRLNAAIESGAIQPLGTKSTNEPSATYLLYLLERFIAATKRGEALTGRSGCAISRMTLRGTFTTGGVLPCLSLIATNQE